MITVFNFIILKAEKEELKMSPSVQCLSVRMPRCSFQADSDRDELPSMLCKSASRDRVNSDQAGMPLSLQVILCCKFSLCNNVAIVFNYLLCYQVMGIQ